ncbi:MAG: glycosyltransferase family 2 protein [Deltaproteobacteria bacterium]
MDQCPPISIVTPSLNQGDFIEETIRSVLSQDYPHMGYAVIDGGSTDHTLKILTKYSDKIKWISTRDRGQAAAINQGLLQRVGSLYVGWLNSDDLLLPGGLRSMALFLDHHPEYVAAFGKAYIINEAGTVIGEYLTRPFSKRSFAVRCTICQPASLIRRWAWDAVGGLDESIDACMDYDLWWRLSEIGRMGHLERFVACTRDHPHSKTRTQRKKVNEEAIAILLRHRGMVPRNWCMANILEGLVDCRHNTYLGRRWEAIRRYVLINKWKALLPQNWLLS